MNRSLSTQIHQEFHMYSKRAFMSALSVLGAAIVACALPIYSQANEPARTERMSFQRANLQSDEGVRKVYILIVQAANSACETSTEDAEVIVRGSPGACVQAAVARAVRQIDSQKLIQVYIAHNGMERAREYGVSDAVRSAGN